MSWFFKYFFQECRKLNVQCIVAPYEADAQLAYLSKEGLVDVVITEDSDLLVFGARKVFYKMDEFGNGKLIEMKDLGKAHKNLIVSEGRWEGGEGRKEKGRDARK